MGDNDRGATAFCLGKCGADENLRTDYTDHKHVCRACAAEVILVSWTAVPELVRLVAARDQSRVIEGEGPQIADLIQKHEALVKLFSRVDKERSEVLRNVDMAIEDLRERVHRIEAGASVVAGSVANDQIRVLEIEIEVHRADALRNRDIFDALVKSHDERGRRIAAGVNRKLEAEIEVLRESLDTARSLGAGNAQANREIQKTLAERDVQIERLKVNNDRDRAEYSRKVEALNADIRIVESANARLSALLKARANALAPGSGLANTAETEG